MRTSITAAVAVTTGLFTQFAHARVAPDFLDKLIDGTLEERFEERDVDYAAPTAVWVTIDDDGQPSTTFTPSYTTDASTTSLVDPAPHDLTASVYTWVTWGKATTSTGEPPNPTATSSNNEGSFSRCYNMDGEYAPLCRPSLNSTLLTGTTYFVTWDPDFFNTTGESLHENTTIDISVRIEYLNTTRNVNEWVKLETSDKTRPATHGFWPFKVESKHLKGKSTNQIRLQLLTSRYGSAEKVPVEGFDGYPLKVENPGWSDHKPSPAPSNRDLIIALPVALGSVALLVLGVCLWNRKTRRISLGNISTRARRGYSSHRFRKANGMGLEPVTPEAPDYRDFELPTVPAGRRDSDLGSLAGSPTTDSFQHQGNAFRDEISRQNEQRRGVDRFL
jgi:hypothetical protein